MKNLSNEDNLGDFRKIQVTGGSTYIISLPKTWVEKMKLERGSVVSLHQSGDMSLNIRPQYDSNSKKPKKVIITITHKDKPESVVRQLISSYLKGYNIIQILSSEKRIDPETRFAVKDFVRKKLVGTEILSDFSNDLTLQILLSYTDLLVKDALKRMSILAVSMYQEAIQTLSSDDPQLAKDVINMDDEVDRFNFYVTRLLNIAVMDEQVMKEIGIASPRHCLGYRLIAKFIERLADHAANIAKNRLALHLVPLSSEILENLNKLSQSAINVYETAIKSLLDEDYFEADKAMFESDETRNMEDEVIQRVVKSAPVEDIPQLRLIIESISRTSEYGADIAEAVLNLTVSDAVSEG